MIGVDTVILAALLSVAAPAGQPAPGQSAAAKTQDSGPSSGQPGAPVSDAPTPDTPDQLDPPGVPDSKSAQPGQPGGKPNAPSATPDSKPAKPGQPGTKPNAPSAAPDFKAGQPLPDAPSGTPDSKAATPGQPSDTPTPAAAAPDPNLTQAPAFGTPGQPLPEPDTGTDGPITLVAEISPEPSNIGDLLTLTVTAAYPAGYSVNLPTGINFGSLHRVSVEESEPESTGTGFRKQFRISLQAFAVGEGRVPAFPLTYLDDKGEVHTVNAPATTFTVESLLANENEPKRQLEDPPISLEYPNDRLELVIYSALAALLLGFIGMMLWGRWRRRTKPVYQPPPTPAHEVALCALDELEQRSLVEDGKFQLYYLELTEITKGYIEGRFGIEALDRTTEEIRRELLREAKRIEPLNASDVVDFLQACDLVKFARFAPPVEDASGALGAVRTMVEQSLPSLAPEQEAPTSDSESSADTGQATAPPVTANEPVTAQADPAASPENAPAPASPKAQSAEASSQGDST